MPQKRFTWWNNSIYLIVSNNIQANVRYRIRKFYKNNDTKCNTFANIVLKEYLFVIKCFYLENSNLLALFWNHFYLQSIAQAQHYRANVTTTKKLLTYLEFSTWQQPLPSYGNTFGTILHRCWLDPLNSYWDSSHSSLCFMDSLTLLQC